MALPVCLIAGFSTTVFWPLDLTSLSSECNHTGGMAYRLLMSWRIQEADSKYIKKCKTIYSDSRT